MHTLVAALFLGAACGGGGEVEEEEDESTAPTTTTTRGERAGAEVEATSEVEPGDEPEGSTDTGATAPKDRLQAAVDRTRSVSSLQIRLELSFDGGSALGSRAVAIEGAIATNGTRADIITEVEGESESVRILVVDDRAFVGGDGNTVRGALPDDAEWAEVGAADLLSSPSFSNPGDLTFLYLLNGAVDIEDLGDGRYRFDLDLDQAAAEAPADLRQDVERIISFSGDATPEVTGTAELDDEGRITTFDVSGIQRPTEEEREQLDLGDDEGIKIGLGVSIDQIDEPVDVEAPEEGVVDIADAPEVAALLELEAT